MTYLLEDQLSGVTIEHGDHAGKAAHACRNCARGDNVTPRHQRVTNKFIGVPISTAGGPRWGFGGRSFGSFGPTFKKFENLENYALGYEILPTGMPNMKFEWLMSCTQELI